MAKSRILLQLDADPHPSVFDAVVAVDAGAECLLRHGGVTPEQVQDLVHGAMFTRGPDELRQTAIFIGGSDVTAGERLLEYVTNCFFGPMRVSVMFDASGANTTAAAAVLSAARHVTLAGATAAIFAATGPVGRRAAQLLAGEGATVRVASRKLARAESVCGDLAQKLPRAALEPCQTAGRDETAAALRGVQIVFAAGAAGVQLISAELLRQSDTLAVAIDLNAVPPPGIEGTEVTDKAAPRDGVLYYGAIGVGSLKMKIHKAAIQKLFTTNDLVLDAPEIYQLGRDLETLNKSETRNPNQVQITETANDKNVGKQSE